MEIKLKTYNIPDDWKAEDIVRDLFCVGTKPKPRTYFSEYGYRWNNDAGALADNVASALNDLFTKEIAKGYSPREIEYIIQTEVNIMALTSILDLKKLEELQDLSGQKNQ